MIVYYFLSCALSDKNTNIKYFTIWGEIFQFVEEQQSDYNRTKEAFKAVLYFKEVNYAYNWLYWKW